MAAANDGAADMQPLVVVAEQPSAAPSAYEAKSSEAKNSETDGFSQTFVIGSYMCVSSLMLMANKLSVHFLPKPSVVLFLQFFFSGICAYTIGATGLDKVDKLEWGLMQRFMPAAAADIAVIFTGMKALQYSNVETFIVFRASMPIVLAVLDYLFLGTPIHQIVSRTP